MTYRALLPLGSYTRETVYNLVLLILRQNPTLGQCACIGDGPSNIGGVHPLVILERLIEFMHTIETCVSTNDVPPSNVAMNGTYRGSVSPVKRPPHSFFLSAKLAMSIFSFTYSNEVNHNLGGELKESKR